MPVRSPIASVCLGLGLSLAACRRPSPTPEGPSMTWVSIPATDARVRYVGRTYRSDTGVVFSHPGVTVRARFWGDAVRMRLDDAGTGGDVGTNHFDVVVDGAAPKLLAVRPGQGSYLLASDLPVGLHTVELFKRTESLVGASTLLALEVHGEFREPPPRHTGLKLEFIGDSITCGYGTDVTFIPETSSSKAPGFTSKHQNPRRGHAWLTAQRLGAEAVFVCYSGHGVYRNLDLSTSGLIPALYERAVPDHPATWDFSNASPDVIVLNAGTNDTFAGAGTAAFLPDEAAFKAAYRTFLERLRALHPRAHIVCTLGSMTDGFKRKEQQGVVTSVHVGDWISQLVAERQRLGDARVHRHVMAMQNPFADGVGEDWHPSAATHQKMAESLSRFIQDVVRP
ncbi:SGNH/GDSL hydrolase family protein [Corallococcus sp. CA054B]|uniref:SGNH/GDSL hydrolase family protein n=1 Tax=Corallococcus sp. CA054B TaxID=2316734 RepID=UPI001F342BBA|nr:SGNH/GDSL hydrolase family protein [Corallococcus sp. CA054B]